MKTLIATLGLIGAIAIQAQPASARGDCNTNNPNCQRAIDYYNRMNDALEQSGAPRAGPYRNGGAETGNYGGGYNGGNNYTSGDNGGSATDEINNALQQMQQNLMRRR